MSRHRFSPRSFELASAFSPWQRSFRFVLPDLGAFWRDARRLCRARVLCWRQAGTPLRSSSSLRVMGLFRQPRRAMQGEPKANGPFVKRLPNCCARQRQRPNPRPPIWAGFVSFFFAKWLFRRACRQAWECGNRGVDARLETIVAASKRSRGWKS